MAQCIDPYLKGSGLSHFPLGWRRARRKARRCTINPIAKCCQHAASQLNSTRALLLRIRNMDCGLCHQHCCLAGPSGQRVCGCAFDWCACSCVACNWVCACYISSYCSAISVSTVFVWLFFFCHFTGLNKEKVVLVCRKALKKLS